MLIVKYCSSLNLSGFSKLICQPQNAQYSRAISKSVQEKFGLPEGPRRPVPPFLKYAVEQRPAIIKENPNLKQQEIIKKISVSWKQLDDKAKLPMQEEYKHQLAEYSQKNQKYVASLPQDKLAEIERAAKEAREKRSERKIKVEKKNLGKPKRPMSSYLLFVQDKLAQSGQKASKEVVKKLSEEWRHCSEKEKEHYKQKADEETRKYLKDVDQWEKKMLASGRDDLVRLRSQIVKTHSKQGSKETVASPETKKVTKGRGKKTAEKK